MEYVRREGVDFGWWLSAVATFALEPLEGLEMGAGLACSNVAASGTTTMS